jgi:hypothetical protein
MQSPNLPQHSPSAKLREAQIILQITFYNVHTLALLYATSVGLLRASAVRPIIPWL